MQVCCVSECVLEGEEFLYYELRPSLTNEICVPNVFGYYLHQHFED